MEIGKENKRHHDLHSPPRRLFVEGIQGGGRHRCAESRGPRRDRRYRRLLELHALYGGVPAAEARKRFVNHLPTDFAEDLWRSRLYPPRAPSVMAGQRRAPLYPILGICVRARAPGKTRRRSGENGLKTPAA